MNVRFVCSVVGLPLGLLLIAASAPSPAWGAEPADTLTTAWTDRARDLYNEGRDLYAREQWAKAHAAFRAAEGVKKHWQIAAMLGHCEVRLGRYRDAAEHLAWALRVGAHSPSATELMSMQDALEIARAHVGAMIVQVVQPGAEIVVDDIPVGTTPLLDPIFVAPGSHRFEARATERTSVQTTVELSAGASRILALNFVEGAVKVTQAEPMSRHDRGLSARQVSLISGAGLTAVALGLGVAFSMKRSSADSDVKSASSRAVIEHGVFGCTGSCAELRSATDRRNSASQLSAGAYVTAMALGSATLASWLLWPSNSPRGTPPCSGFVRHAFGDDDRCASTAKQAVVVGLVATSLVSYGAAVGFELHARSMVSDKQEAVERAGGAQFACRNGLSSSGCLDLSGSQDGARQAIQRRNLFLATGSAAMVGSLATVLLWPNQRGSSTAAPIELSIAPSTGGSVASVTGQF